MNSQRKNIKNEIDEKKFTVKNTKVLLFLKDSFDKTFTSRDLRPQSLNVVNVS